MPTEMERTDLFQAVVRPVTGLYNTVMVTLASSPIYIIAIDANTEKEMSLRMLVLTAAISAASCHNNPVILASREWDGAKVCGQVTSQTRTLPLFQGITVAPSRCLPSALQITSGSRWVEIFAEARDLLIKSFTAACMDGVPDSYGNVGHVCPSGSPMSHKAGSNLIVHA